MKTIRIVSWINTRPLRLGGGLGLVEFRCTIVWYRSDLLQSRARPIVNLPNLIMSDRPGPLHINLYLNPCPLIFASDGSFLTLLTRRSITVLHKYSW